MSTGGNFYDIYFDNYLDDGSFGVSYKGIDTRKGAAISVKMISIHNNDDRNLARTEIRILKHINQHPNITELLDTCTEHDCIWMMQEYCNRGNLEKYLGENELSAAGVVDIVLQTAKAVKFLHARSPAVIHRDIKPRNILLQKQTGCSIIVKLGGYGLSQMANEKEDNTSFLSIGRDINAAVGYRAPELYRSDVRNTVAADVYSLGLILYTLVLYCDKHEQYLPPMIDNTCVGKKMNQTKKDVKLETGTIYRSYLHRYIGMIKEMIKYKPVCRMKIENVVGKLKEFDEDDRELFGGSTDLYEMKAKLDGKNKEVVNMLMEISACLDKQTVDVRIAKTSFAAAGIVSGGLAITGFALSFFTAGASLILTGVGAGIGAATGAGVAGTAIVDKVLDKKHVTSAQETTDIYQRMLLMYLEKKRIDDEARQNRLHGTSANTQESFKSVVKFFVSVTAPAVTAVRQAVSVGQIAAKIGSAANVASRTTFGTLGTAAKVFAVAEPGIAGLGIAVNIGVLVYNSIHIHKKTPSETAILVRDQAENYNILHHFIVWHTQMVKVHHELLTRF